ncbi:MAG: hypothetical protein ACOC5T_02745 [Elusimicrobiota bacterium]
MKVMYVFSDGKQNILFDETGKLVKFLKSKRLPNKNIKEILDKHCTNINGFVLTLNYMIEMEKDKDYQYIADEDRMIEMKNCQKTGRRDESN